MPFLGRAGKKKYKLYIVCTSLYKMWEGGEV